MKDLGVAAITVGNEESLLPALLFDYVIPTWGSAAVPSSVICPSLNMDAISDSKYPQIFAAKTRLESIRRVLGVEEVPPEHLKTILGVQFALQLADLARKRNVRVCAAYDDPVIYSEYSSPGDYTALQITIDNLPLPDARSLSWEQVLEVRKDQKFHSQLRDLRLYVDREFGGKDHNYIVDRLSKDLEEYEAGARKHGLTLLKACTKKILSAHTILATACVTTMAAITGQPLAAVGALAAAAPLASLAIELAEIPSTLRGQKQNPELAFLVNLKRLRDVQ
jgi:hypothetical protein